MCHQTKECSLGYLRALDREGRLLSFFHIQVVTSEATYTTNCSTPPTNFSLRITLVATQINSVMLKMASQMEYELYSLYKEPNIVENIKIRRIKWVGHIIRIEEERIPKKVLNRNFHTTRPVGRPWTRWADVVQRDALQLPGIRGWRRRVANKDEWRRLMREAKAQKGV